MAVHQHKISENFAISYYQEQNSSFEIEPAEAGLRLDHVLAARFPERSRSAWKSLIASQAVLVNHRPAAKSLVLRAGWQVSLPPASAPIHLLPDQELAGHLATVHSDDWMLVVDKPAGVPSHPLEAGETGTVANALAAMDPALATSGPKALEGGLVHRLDIQTSGLLVCACSPVAFAALTDLFRRHLATKTYLAIVQGEMSDDCIIDWPVAHHARSDRRMVAVRPGEPKTWRGQPRPARSEVVIIEKLSGMTVVSVAVHQAQMHQIRVHLAALGHPLVADAVYGGPTPAEGWPGGLLRHALHAWKLDMPHPSGPGELHVRAELPADLRACIAAGGGRFNPGPAD